MNNRIHRAVVAVVVVLPAIFIGIAPAGTLKVAIENGGEITAIGAFRRWDADGNPRKPVDPKAQIDAPQVDAEATHRGEGNWVFENLDPGKYDLVLLGKNRLRIEGWEYAPVLEFDSFFPPTATVDQETRDWIFSDVRKSRHYENKVVPLSAGGDNRAVRLLVMLIRDLPTSYTPGTGTLRFEIWQYTSRYGSWTKEKRTRVMHRLLLPVARMRRWTWIWEPSLGAVEITQEPTTIRYRVPKPDELKQRPGLHRE